MTAGRADRIEKAFFKAEKTENERLDVFLAGAAEGLSRAHALKLIEAGNVKSTEQPS